MHKETRKTKELDMDLLTYRGVHNTYSQWKSKLNKNVYFS